MKRPLDIYRPSNRIMPKKIAPFEYPANYLVRRISRAGTIRVVHNQVFVSLTLMEDYVGLEDVDDGIYDLFFCYFQIGRHELRTNKVHGIVSKVGLTVQRIDHWHKV
jgi:putative transposase